MLEQIRDRAARALLPVILFSLALLLIPFEHDASSVNCMRWTADREMRTLPSVDPAVMDRMSVLTAQILGASRTARDHFDWLFLFVCTSSAAYLLFSRERFCVRLAVVEGVALTAVIIPVATGSIC